MPYITKDELYQVFDKASQQGQNPDDIVDQFIAKGYEIEGVNSSYSLADHVSQLLPSFGKNVKEILHFFGGLVTREDKETGKTKFSLGGAVDTGKQILNLSGAITEGVQQFARDPKGAIKLINERGEVGRKKALDRYFDENISEESRQILSALYLNNAKRYGTWDRIKNTVENDTFGVISDIAMLAQGGGAALKLGSKAAKVAGAAKAAEKIAKTAKYVAKAGDMLEPTMIVTDYVPAALRKASRKSAEAFYRKTKFGEKMEEYASAASQMSFKPGSSEAVTIYHKYGKNQFGKLLAKYGMNGTPKQIREQAKQLKNIAKGTVDWELDIISKKYPNRRIANNFAVDNAFTKLEDIVGITGAESVDEAIAMMKKKNIIDPDSHKFAKDILQYKTKYLDEGLSVKELNDVKRIYDRIGNPYKSTVQSSGMNVTFVAAEDAGKAADLERVLTRLRNTIDAEAKKSGFHKYRQLNQDTQFANDAHRIMDDVIATYRDKTNFTDSFVLMGGVMGSVLSLTARVFATAAGVTGLRVYIKSPKFASAFANEVMRLKGSQFEIVSKAMKTGRQTAQSRKIIRRIIKNLQPAFPGIRLVERSGASGEY